MRTVPLSVCLPACLPASLSLSLSLCLSVALVLCLKLSFSRARSALLDFSPSRSPQGSGSGSPAGLSPRCAAVLQPVRMSMGSPRQAALAKRPAERRRYSRLALFSEPSYTTIGDPYLRHSTLPRAPLSFLC